MFVLKEDREGNRAFFNLNPGPDAANRVTAIELPIKGEIGETVFLKTADGVERPVVTRRRGGKIFLRLEKDGPLFRTHDHNWLQYHIGGPIVAVCMARGAARIEADWCGCQPGDQFFTT